MLKYIDMTAVVIVCFLAQGLLVTAYPTGQYDANVAYMDYMVYPVERVVAPAPNPAAGSVSIYGNWEGSYVPISEPSLLFFEDLPFQYYDVTDALTDTAHFGSILADSILAEREAEIEAKLAEIDAFVESKFGQTNTRVNSALLHVNAAIDSDLKEMESRYALEFKNIDDIESELELALAPAWLETQMAADMAQTEALVMRELTKVDSSVELGLAKCEALMESELEKVDSYVESKLAQNEALVESELSKINSFVDSELSKTEALMKLELAKMDSFVETELAKPECLMTSQLLKMNSIIDSTLENVESATNSKVTMFEVPVEGVVEFSGVTPASGRTKIFGNTGYIPVNSYSDLEEPFEDKNIPVMGEVFCETVPVSGRTRIAGHTGCPPIVAVKTIPKTHMINDVTLTDPVETGYDLDPGTVPVIGAVFSGKAPAKGRVKIVGRGCPCPPVFPSNPPVVGNANPSIQNVQRFNEDLYLRLINRESDAPNVSCADGVFSKINILPIVNIIAKQIEVSENGDVEFFGTARVSTSTTLAAEFECAPLLPTEVTPDGRKFIWLSKKSTSNGTPTSPEQTNKPPRIDIPITTYPIDFPETIIMDSNKNYERFLDNVEVIPVAGGPFFEGVAPAHGSVHLTGQSSC